MTQIFSSMFDPERHTHLLSQSWDEQFVREQIVELVDGVISKQGDNNLWPSEMVGFESSLYEGAAGIRWAIQKLAERRFCAGLESVRIADIEADYSNWIGSYEMFEVHKVPVSYSFYLGMTGPLLQRWMETRDAELLDVLDEKIRENIAHPWMENLWGAPSTMLVASHLFELTGEERFSEHVRLGAEYLWDRLETVKALDCKLWNIFLYGSNSYLMGAGHGFVGNAYPVIRSAKFLPDAVNDKWAAMVYDTVVKTALRRDGLANWAPRIELPFKDLEKILVQQCHGSPGFVISLGALMGQGNDEFDTIMLEAGEMVWRAGPLVKYPELCHGTPGNGYAFLKLYEKTGNPLWLARARDFANHSIRQRQDLLNSGKPQQFSLWDGDMGLAMYLADCLQEKTQFPTLDYF